MSADIAENHKIEIRCASVNEQESEDFLRAIGEEILAPIQGSFRLIGAFKGSKLVALAQFGSAADKSDSHTTLLIRLATVDPLDKNTICALVEFYRFEYRPSDILTYILTADLAQQLNFDVRDDGAYEWFDRTKSYYTYKITASDSDKYYYGVRGFSSVHATLEEAKSDNYWGSGGVKFQRWKARHRDQLQKEIINIHRIKARAYADESNLVGDAWLFDQLCLNSIEGGRLFPPTKKEIRVELKVCNLHGETKHKGDSCCKCVSAATGSLRFCEVHGESYHHGFSCRRCSRLKSMSYSNCSVHGEGVIFIGENCAACLNLKTVSKQQCSVHGRSTFQGSSCVLCVMESRTSLRECSIHGVSKHYSGTCCKCTSSKRVSIDNCDTHGEATFLDGQCSHCENISRLVLQECPIHGTVKHMGSTCMSCSSASSLSVRDCSIHGRANHLGDSCCSCNAQNAISMRECSIHGLTKHQGVKCSSCTNGKLISMKFCSIHGESKHRGDTCYKCALEKRAKSVIKKCPIHGEAKHQGNSCAKCRIEKRTHNSKHTDNPVDTCQFC